MKINTSNTYLSIERKESNAIKGIAIILIIIGHCYTLIDDSSHPLYFYLYSFHVHVFFILPFLYPPKTPTIHRCKNYFARLMVPYIILFTLFFLLKNGPYLFLLCKNGQFVYMLNFITTGGVKCLLTGGLVPLRQSIGIIYIWFMPVMFSMYILKDIYYEVSFKYKILILLTGIVSYFFMWMCLYGKLGVLTQIKVILMNISPFSVIQAVGALFLGVVTIQFVTVMERVRNRVGWIVLGITFMTLLYFLTQSSYYELIPKSFLPILVFAFLYYMRTFISRNSWLCRYGEISFAIYLVQSPICIIANAIVPRYIETRHSITGVIVIVILICISYYVANLLNKSRLAKRFLLPRTWDEVLNSKR